MLVPLLESPPLVLISGAACSSDSVSRHLVQDSNQEDPLETEDLY